MIANHFSSAAVRLLTNGTVKRQDSVTQPSDSRRAVNGASVPSDFKKSERNQPKGSLFDVEITNVSMRLINENLRALGISFQLS